MLTTRKGLVVSTMLTTIALESATERADELQASIEADLALAEQGSTAAGERAAKALSRLEAVIEEIGALEASLAVPPPARTSARREQSAPRPCKADEALAAYRAACGN